MKILVCDDNIEYADNLADILRDQGYEVKAVYEGLDALDEIHRDNFDVALIDIVMPVINGYDVCRRIKKIDPSVIIIGMSAFESIQARSQDYLLIKPLSLDHLIELLKSPKGPSGMIKS